MSALCHAGAASQLSYRAHRPADRLSEQNSIEQLCCSIGGGSSSGEATVVGAAPVTFAFTSTFESTHRPPLADRRRDGWRLTPCGALFQKPWHAIDSGVQSLFGMRVQA